MLTKISDTICVLNHSSIIKFIISIFILGCCPCPIKWGWQHQPMPNTGCSSISVLRVNASQTTLTDISLDKFRHTCTRLISVINHDTCLYFLNIKFPLEKLWFRSNNLHGINCKNLIQTTINLWVLLLKYRKFNRALVGSEVRAPGPWKSNGALVKFCLRAQWIPKNWRIGNVWRDPSNFAWGP